MGTVIGFKGSQSQRKAAWITLLKLRKSMAYSRTNPKFKECLWMEKTWYQDEFRAYVA